MSDLYKVGGALPLDAPSYIRRQADRDLYEGLLTGEFCYVLNSRQMGKSSLRVQTKRRLQEAGVACAAIDITKVGSQGITPQEWYAGVLFTLIDQLQLPLTLQQFEDWWEARRLLSPVNLFSEFIDGVLLNDIAGRIVIFIDEIDSILQLDFKDDFFAAIRACYNKRAENPEFDRLTFALLGVATPSNLIQDKNRTPFNIGRAIQLNGLQFEEARSLAQGLVGKAANPETVLQAILNWTGGQPFLTQKLCQLVLASNGSIAEGEETDRIEQLVRNRIIENWESQDEPEHLRTIRDRLRADKERQSRLLGLCQEVLKKGELAVEDNNDDQLNLSLTGIAVRQAGKLQVYNQIYREVFNAGWVERTLSTLRPDFYVEALKAWLVSGKQDKSLLRGQALRNALDWRTGKSLSTQDDEFLDISQQQEREESQQALAAQEAARLETANRKATNRIKFGSTVLVITLLIACFSASYAELKRRDAEKGKQDLSKTQVALRQAEAQEKTAKQQSQKSELIKQIAEAQEKTAKQQSQKSELIKQIAEAQEKQAEAKLEQAEASLKRLKQESQVATEQSLAAHRSEQFVRAKFESAERKLKQANKDIKVAVVARNQAQKDQSIAQEGTRLEREANTALEQFHASNNQVEALLLAMDAGKNLQELIKRDNRLNQPIDYTATNPILALRTILSDIHLQNSFSRSESIKFINFNRDGQCVVIHAINGKTQLFDFEGQPINESESCNSRIEPFYRIISGALHLSAVDSSGQTVADLPFNFKSLSRLSGKRVVVIDENSTAQIWEAGRIIFSVPQTKTAFQSINSQYSVTVGLDNIARIWDASGKQLNQFLFDKGQIPDMQFSSDEQHIIGRYNDKTAKVWNLMWQQLAQFSDYKFYNDDANLIVTMSSSSAPVLWDLLGRKVASVGKETDRDTNIEFIPGGKRVLITSGKVKQTFLYDTSGKLLADLGQVKKTFFSPDGIYLVSTLEKGSATICNTNGKKLASLGEDKQEIADVAFMTKSQRIITVGGNTASLWNFSGQQLRQMKNFSGSAEDIRFTPDGSRAVIVSKQTQTQPETAQFWNFYQGLSPIASLKNNQGKISRVVFSSDGQRILIINQDKTASLWNSSGRKIAQYRDLIEFDDRTQLMILQEDGTVYVQDLTGRKIIEFPKDIGEVKSVSISPDRRKYFVNGNVLVVMSNELKRIQFKNALKNSIIQISLSKDSRYLVIFTAFRGMYVLDMSKFEIAKLQGNDGFTLEQHLYNNQYITAKTDDRIWKMWNVSGQLLEESQSRINFSSDGNYALVVSREGIVKLLDLLRKKTVQLATAQNQSAIADFSFNNRGKTNYVYICEEDGTIKVFNLVGRLIAQLRGHERVYRMFDISESSSKSNIIKFVTFGANGTVRFWNALGQQPGKSLEGLHNKIERLVISPLGIVIVEEGFVHFWDIDGRPPGIINGQLVNWNSNQYLAIKTGDNALRVVNFLGERFAEYKGYLSSSPNGDLIATAEEDGTVKLWRSNLGLDELMVQSCSWLHDYINSNPEGKKYQYLCKDLPRPVQKSLP